jgi:hypothetical protein
MKEVYPIIKMMFEVIQNLDHQKVIIEFVDRIQSKNNPITVRR